MQSIRALPTRLSISSGTHAGLGHFAWAASWLRSAEVEYARDANITLYNLMRTAAAAAFKVLRKEYGNACGARWVIFCGTGNNGGDGFEIARLAMEVGQPVKLVVVDPSKSRPPEASAAYRALMKDIQTSNNGMCTISTVDEWLQDSASLRKEDVVVDALLGSGMTGSPRGDYAQLINRINELPGYRFAVDIPSGLDAETGFAEGPCLRADHTVTFIAMKPGLLTGQARNYVGKLHYCSLQTDKWMLMEKNLQEAMCCHLTHDHLDQLLQRPSSCAHKGSNGKVVLIGGDLDYGGAIIMAAEAALRSGAGLVRVLTRIQHAVPLMCRSPEVMMEELTPSSLKQALEWSTCYAVGPGMGTSEWSWSFFNKVLAYSCENPQKPSVWDADALTCLAGLHASAIQVDDSPPRMVNSVFTPHPGEAARMLRCSILDVERDRFLAAKKLADQYGGVALLKGPGTVIHVAKDAEPIVMDAEVETKVPLKCAVANVGNCGMATGGMGDILTGTIAGLLAQKMPIWKAACAGSLMHGTAADLAVRKRGGERGLTATEVLSCYATVANPNFRSDL